MHAKAATNLKFQEKERIWAYLHEYLQKRINTLKYLKVIAFTMLRVYMLKLGMIQVLSDCSISINEENKF